jgi:hypothetical protein
VSRIASDFEKGFGTGAEQEIVEDLLVLQDQWRQAAGECEDHVQVAGREQFSSTRSDERRKIRELGTIREPPLAVFVDDDASQGLSWRTYRFSIRRIKSALN